MLIRENILLSAIRLNILLNNRRKNNDPIHKIISMEIYTRYNLLGIFVRLLQSVILAILSRSMETYDDVDYVYDKYAYNNIKHINEEIL